MQVNIRHRLGRVEYRCVHMQWNALRKKVGQELKEIGNLLIEVADCNSVLCRSSMS